MSRSLVFLRDAVPADAAILAELVTQTVAALARDESFQPALPAAAE